MRLVLASLLVLAALAAAPSASADACVPTNGGGMDYHSQACVDPSDRKCPVYHEQHTDSGIRKTCVPP
jgi:hypothetical protein